MRAQQFHRCIASARDRQMPRGVDLQLRRQSRQAVAAGPAHHAENVCTVAAPDSSINGIGQREARQARSPSASSAPRSSYCRAVQPLIEEPPPCGQHDRAKHPSGSGMWPRSPMRMVSMPATAGQPADHAFSVPISRRPTAAWSTLFVERSTDVSEAEQPFIGSVSPRRFSA